MSERLATPRFELQNWRSSIAKVMGELKAKQLQQENKELELKAKQLEQENKALQENKELHLGLTGYQVCVSVGLCVLQRNKTVRATLCKYTCKPKKLHSVPMHWAGQQVHVPMQ